MCCTPMATRWSGLPSWCSLALACFCFARLIAHPAALIVDGERPSIDHANPGEPRGVGNDATFFFLPHHLSIARVIRTFGHLPLWDDRGFGGRPMVGNPQAGMFYPPVWLAWWSGAPAALGLAHGRTSALGRDRHLCAVRSFPLGRWAATVAAAIYQASPFLLAHTFEGHYPHVWAACWYPWAFWASASIVRPVRGRLLLPVILALTLLTGHPQEWFLLVLALTAWSLFDAWKTWRTARPAAGRAQLVGWAAVLGIIDRTSRPSMSLRKLAVRPWLAAIPMPPRSSRSRGVITCGSSMPGSCSAPRLWGAVRLFRRRQLLGDRFLDRAGAARPGGRRGRQIPRSPAGARLARARRPGHLARLRTAPGALRPGISHVPGMNWFRVPARSLFLANLAGAVLAGLGVETLRTSPGNSP